MKNKRLIGIIFLALFLTPLISAQSFDFNNAKQQVTRVLDSAVGIINPLAEIIIGEYSGSEYFFEKLLILGLLFILITAVLRKVKLFGEDGSKLPIIISAIVSIIAIRFISTDELFFGILLPYGVMGAALSFLIPFILFFYAIHKFFELGSAGRKFSWAIFTIFFVVFMFYYASDLSGAVGWIYFLGIILCIFMIIFDKGVHRALFVDPEINNVLKEADKRHVNTLLLRYERLSEANNPRFEEEKEEIRKKLKRYGIRL